MNKQWRLVFRWHGQKGEASGVYLDDHSYRRAERRVTAGQEQRPTAGVQLARAECDSYLVNNDSISWLSGAGRYQDTQDTSPLAKSPLH